MRTVLGYPPVDDGLEEPVPFLLTADVMGLDEGINDILDRGRFAIGIRSDGEHSIYPTVARRFEMARTQEELWGIVYSLRSLDAAGQLGSNEPLLDVDRQLAYYPARFRASLKAHFFPYSE